MEKFKVKAYSVEYFETEIEANSKEEAEDKLVDKWENSEIESEGAEFLFEDTEGFDIINDLFVEDTEE